MFPKKEESTLAIILTYLDTFGELWDSGELPIPLLANGIVCQSNESFGENFSKLITMSP